MPVWLILVAAGLVLVVGVSWPTVVRMRRSRRSAFGVAVADIRSRIEALDYRLDQQPPGTNATAAVDLRNTAQAMVSVAEQRTSTKVCRDAEAVLARAERALDARPGSNT